MRRLLAVAAIIVAGCNDQDAQGGSVSPVAMTEEAVGHYCQMNVLDHDGPKAQVHLEGNEHPIWFVQIRDAFAFDRMPEQSARVAAVFVNDMGASGSTWANPGIGNWIPAAKAHYVTGSSKRGGMGAPDFIPFARHEDAAAFQQKHGGEVIAYGEITDAIVLAPVEVDLRPAGGEQGGGS